MVAIMIALHSCDGPLAARAIFATRVADVIQAAATVWDVASQDVLAERVLRQFAHPRLAVYWIANRILARSTGEIGRILGRDHSTIMSGVRSAEQLSLRDPAFRLRLTQTIQTLGLPDTAVPCPNQGVN
jgi:chromosomal replication initiation ATPase DnaA